MEKIARLDWIARAGFIARGLLYILFGTIAITARHRADEGESAVFDALQTLPGGGLWLMAAATGLIAYGVYRLACAELDIEGKGHSWKGRAARLAQAGSGLAHLALAWTAIEFLIGSKRGSDDETSKQAARTLLDLPLGTAALYALAGAMFVAGALQLRKAWKASHMKQCRADTPEIARTIGRIGLVARGAVFALIGWSFIRAGQTEQASEAISLGGALASLRSNEAQFLAVAIGLILFGVFSLLLARYRIVPPVDVVAATKREIRAHTA